MTIEEHIERARVAGFTVREIRYVSHEWEVFIHQDIGESTHFDELVRRVKVPRVRLRASTPTEAVKRAVDFMIENPEHHPGNGVTKALKQAAETKDLLEAFK